MKVSLSLTDSLSCCNESVFVRGITHHCVTGSKGKQQNWLQSPLAVWTVLNSSQLSKEALNHPLAHIMASALLNYCARWSTESTVASGCIAQA